MDRAASAPVVVQRGEADEHAEPQEPRLVEQEVPQELRRLVALLPAAELKLDDADASSGLVTYAVSACAAA